MEKALSRAAVLRWAAVGELSSNRISIFIGARATNAHCRKFSSSRRKSDSVRILEVGPRDGLQNIKTTVATSVKVDLIKRLADAGLKNIEATSFVSPKWIPQLADGNQVFGEVLSLAQQRNSVSLPVLVPNLKGLERAAACGAKDVVVFVSASEGFSIKNINCTVEEGITKAREVAEKALAGGMKVRGVVSCIFYDPYDGPVEPTKVLYAVKALLDMGCYEVGLGDTLGVGTPTDVAKLLNVLLAEVPTDKLAGHFHDTYGQAVANVVKSYDMGIKSFDSAVAGLGGCPYAKGAKGNLSTEDMAYMFERSGVQTGINLDKLVSVGEWISQHLGQPNGSRAGSALYAKRPEHARREQDKAAATQTKPKREWKLVEDTGEYTVARSGNAIKITLTRPENGNALTNSMVEGLTSLFRKLATDRQIFHIFFTSEGRFFCTGMDLSSGSSSSGDAAAKADYYVKVFDLFAAIDNAPQTTIAVINGSCYGGGNGLAFVCDIRLATSQAKFTMTEVKLGLSPAIISKFMIREWGVAFARDAILTGREVSATELHRIGTLQALADTKEEMEALIEDYADKFGRCAPKIAAMTKDLVQLGWMDPGGDKQEKKIKETFDVMMAPGSEGEHGLAKFRAKIKAVDWSRFWTEKARL